MLANIITLGIVLAIGITLFTTLSGELDKMEDSCLELNTTVVGCEMIGEGSPFNLIFKNRIILFIMMFIPFWIIMGRTISNLFRGVMSGIADFFEDSFNITNNNNDDRKEQYLKEVKSKLEQELNRKSKKIQKKVPKEGVSWGTGVELGKGIDSYEKNE